MTCAKLQIPIPTNHSQLKIGLAYQSCFAFGGLGGILYLCSRAVWSIYSWNIWLHNMQFNPVVWLHNVQSKSSCIEALTILLPRSQSAAQPSRPDDCKFDLFLFDWSDDFWFTWWFLIDLIILNYSYDS